MAITLQPLPLTSERFAPYGEVIQAGAGHVAAMNAARFERFDELCTIDVDKSGRVAISIARSRSAASLPYRIDMVERHPLGTQAFVPLTPFRFIVVVGPPGESIDAEDLRAFETNGRQGVNYRRGAWHMPLIAFSAGQEFLIIDYAGKVSNCEEYYLDEPVTLVAARPA